MALELYTFLAKVQTVLKDGYYGEMVIVDHQGNKFKSCCGNITATTLKSIRTKWTFLRFEYRNEKFYFNKAVPCKPLVAELMIEEYRTQKREAEQAKQENNEAIAGCA